MLMHDRHWLRHVAKCYKFVSFCHISAPARLAYDWAVTPVLSAVYEELVERAARPPLSGRSQALRQAFFEKSGRFEPDHPSAGSRDAAGWEDALVRGGLAAELATGFDDAAERGIVLALANAHRGVFVFDRADDSIIARDLWSRAEFLMLARDDVARELAHGGLAADSPLCQARLLASPDGCAVLPGTVFHPADAREAIERVLASARGEARRTDDVLDSLLRMEHTWRTLSRVKVGYAYRPEALD